MYAAYFGLAEPPFSISPDPRYLYTSARHQEAMAHLMYGVRDGGGFVQLTGEVGTGKTTLCRWLLDQVPEDLDVALILNPQFDERELLATICDELHIRYHARATPKKLLDLLNARLLESFASGRRTVLIIDEAQILSRPLLEQVRLLTNLETAKQKLLQIILIGQPELSRTLARGDMSQLAQRITARYHLYPLNAADTREYIRYRLAIAGCQRPLFTRSALRSIYHYSRGVPRLINVICDRALLGAYAATQQRVGAGMVRRAAREVLGAGAAYGPRLRWAALAAGIALLVFAAWWYVPRPAVVAEATPVRVEPEPGRSDSPPPDRSEVPARTSASLSAAPSPPQATEAPDPGPLLAPLLAQHAGRTTSDAALRALLAAWGVSLADNARAECQAVPQYKLRCLRARGTWNNLRSYNRASILTLRGPDREYHVLVRRMDSQSVTLDFGGQQYQLPVGEVDRYWFGDYLLLWRPPSLVSTTIAHNSRGVDVLWLRQVLQQVAGGADGTDVSNPEFDSRLRDRVMDFQRNHSLTADGIVGVETLIRLNTLLSGNDVPLLSPRPPS